MTSEPNYTPRVTRTSVDGNFDVADLLCITPKGETGARTTVFSSNLLYSYAPFAQQHLLDVSSLRDSTMSEYNSDLESPRAMGRAAPFN